ncbi:MAG: hypothetical protein V4642_07510 [Bacteroidota bacterium]
MRNSTFLKTLLLSVAVLLVYSVPALAQGNSLDTVWTKAIGGEYDPHSIEFSPDGQLIAASVRGKLMILRADNGNIVHEFTDTSGSADLDYSPNGQLIAAAGEDGKLRIFHKETGLVKVLPIFDTSVGQNSILPMRSVWFLTDSTVFVATYLSQNQIVNISSGEVLVTFDRPYKGVLQGIDFEVNEGIISPDHRIVAIAYNKAVYLYDAATGKQLEVFTPQHYTPVLTPYYAPVDIAFSADSRMIAIVGRGDPFVVKTDDWSILWRLKGHTDIVYAVRFSSDNRFLVTGGDDGTRFWNLETGVNTYTSSLIRLYQLALDDQMKFFAVAKSYNLLNNRAHYNITGIEDTQPKEPTQLLKITPNPVTSECSIHYSVTDPTAHVRLELIGVEGTLIAVLESGQKGEGNYTTLLKTTGISGASLSGGAYFIRLIIDGQAIATQQFSVVR